MKFALITEGVSEHRIIKHIIAKYFKEYEPDINQIQPKLIHEKQDSVGGWVEVLKYCEREELKDIFVENDYLVIQIDTDQSQTPPFSINHFKDNGEVKSNSEILDDVISKLNDLISPEIKDTFGSKIFFAVCIHTIECWLLPIFYANNHKSDTKGCLATLNIELARKNIKTIGDKAKNAPHARQSYASILSNWRKKQDIKTASESNIGFKFFVDVLDKKVII